MPLYASPFYMWRVVVPMKIVKIKTFIIISSHTFDYLLLKTFLFITKLIKP